MLRTGRLEDAKIGQVWLIKLASLEAHLQKGEMARDQRFGPQGIAAETGMRVATVTVALVDGLSPFLAASIVLTPFFVVGLFPALSWVYYTSLGVALLTLFGLGLFLGYISRGNLIPTGSRRSLPV